MIIEYIDAYRDGGTVLIRTNMGHYTIDRRIMTDDDDEGIDNPTKNMLFMKHPDQGTQLSLEESKQIKRVLKSAIKKYIGPNKEFGMTAINSIKLPEK